MLFLRACVLLLFPATSLCLPIRTMSLHRWAVGGPPEAPGAFTHLPARRLVRVCLGKYPKIWLRKSQWGGSAPTPPHLAPPHLVPPQ